MMYVLFLMWISTGNSPGNTQVIEGFQSYDDCNKAYQEIILRKPQYDFKHMSGVCLEVKDVR